MNRIMLLDRYLLRQFFPIFFVAISMFVFLFLLIDLFSNLIRYMNNEVKIITMLKITMFYIPKSVSYATPISLLFAAAYTLGDLYARNELTTVFSTGIPFWRFSIPLLIVGFVFSIMSFFIDDILVIPALKIKNDLSRQALNKHVTATNTNIVIKTNNGRITYSVDYFDFDNLKINGVNIIEMDDNGGFVSQIRAPSAEWKENHWEFRNAKIYKYSRDEILRISDLEPTEEYDEHPDIFRRSSAIVDELPVKEAGLLVKDLRAAGLPYFKEQSKYFHRYSFATTSFIVIILSVSMGGRFRKNILLMSLFTSLSVAVVYYIAEMLSMAMAESDYIHPFVGAWFPVFFFIVIGIMLIRSAKT